MYQVDFLPRRIHQQRVRRRRLVRQGWLLAVCVLAMGLLTHVRRGRIANAQSQLAVLAERADNLQRQISMIPAVEGQMADLLIKKRIDGELGSRADCTGVLAELCRVVPPNMALIALELKTVELRAAPVKTTHRPSASGARSKLRPQPGGTVRRVRLMLTGLAPTDVDVANFIGQLSASCLFEDVNMGYAKTEGFRGRSAREFKANCYLAR